jgi:hypothetical protein
MTDWPLARGLPFADTVITPWTLNSMSGNYGVIGAPVSATYPTASLAMYIPFRITDPLLVTTMFCFNGTVVSGNVDVGIYDIAGTRLVSKGTTAQAGVSAIQTFDITDTLIGAGLFYMAIAVDNITATLYRYAPGGNAQLALVACGLAQQASAFVLPATATFASYANAYVPFFGLSGTPTV